MAPVKTTGTMASDVSYLYLSGIEQFLLQTLIFLLRMMQKSSQLSHVYPVLQRPLSVERGRACQLTASSLPSSLSLLFLEAAIRPPSQSNSALAPDLALALATDWLMHWRLREHTLSKILAMLIISWTVSRTLSSEALYLQLDRCSDLCQGSRTGSFHILRCGVDLSIYAGTSQR